MTRGMMPRTLLPALVAAFLAVGAGDAAAQAHAHEMGVAVNNDYRQVLKVYAVDADGERHLLGMVGNDDFEWFRVPAESMDGGGYRIGVQAVTPLPQLGVPADPHPFVVTPLLTPGDGELVQINVSSELDLSTATVR